MGGCIEAVDFLEGVREPHEARRVPRRAQISEREGPIIEATAGAEAHATPVESHQRQEHDIEPAGTEGFMAVGLGNTEAVVAPAFLPGDEAHGAGLAAAIDAGEIHPASALLGQGNQRPGIELPGKRGVKRDARATLQVQRPIRVAGHAPCAVCPLLVRHLPTLRIEARPQRSAGGLQRV